MSSGNQWGRRDFVKGVAAFTGAAGLCAYDIKLAGAEPPLETTRIRMLRAPIVCISPQYVAEQLLHAEGFTDVEYIEPDSTGKIADEIAQGKIDIGLKTAAYVVSAIDAELPIVVLAGIHAGCYELFGNNKIKIIPDLKGKSVAISAFGASEHVSMANCNSAKLGRRGAVL
jgi:NitT/TauT family transport system substrate-binding protein